MTAINIGLHMGGQVIDLRVPRHVTVSRLCEVISTGLATQGIPIPPNFKLKVLNKAVKLDDKVLISEYPLADGDQMMIVI